MSWLYTIFVAGLLFSNGSDLNLPLAGKSSPETYLRIAGDLVEKSKQTYPLDAKGRISLSNVNGPIFLEPWDRNEVEVEVTKIADCQESLDLININVTAKRDYLSIESEIKSWDKPGVAEQFRNRRIEVQFRLKVPRTAVLNEIEAVNGDVTVSNFVNVTKVSAVNGNIIARDLQGTASLSTVNGEVRAIFDQLDAFGPIDLETVNGRVSVELPSDINATIKADSMNGTIANDFGLPVKKGKTVGRDLHGKIGTGEIPLHLTSVNGGLFITRKKDGKTPGSVTNLLTAKPDEDDEVEDSDVVEVSNAVEVKKGETVARSVNRSVRTAERSVKAAESNVKATKRDLEKMQADVEKMKIEALPDIKVKLDNKEFTDIISEGLTQKALAEMQDSMWSATPVAVEQRSASFDVKGTARVYVDAPMCSVKVRAWDQQSVKYVLTEERISKDNVLRVSQNASENSVTLKVLNPARAPRGMDFWESGNRFRIEVYVPKKSDVTVLSEKDIRIEGVSGNLELTGNDGSVSVRDSEGTLRLRSGDGLIRVLGFQGDLELTTNEAEVYLEGDFTKISASAADSKITLTMPSNKNASISTNTAIQSEGLNIVRDGERTWKLGSGGPKYEFEFAEGQLTVRNQSRVDTN